MRDKIECSPAGASGELKGGRHLQFPKDTHMSNLLLAMLEYLGVRVEKFGDSTGMSVAGSPFGRSSAH